jgi:hypothetical protein
MNDISEKSQSFWFNGNTKLNQEQINKMRTLKEFDFLRQTLNRLGKCYNPETLKMMDEKINDHWSVEVLTALKEIQNILAGFGESIERIEEQKEDKKGVKEKDKVEQYCYFCKAKKEIHTYEGFSDIPKRESLGQSYIVGDKFF